MMWSEKRLRLSPVASLVSTAQLEDSEPVAGRVSSTPQGRASVRNLVKVPK